MATGSSSFAWKPHGRGAWRAAVHGVAESPTQQHTHARQECVLPTCPSPTGPFRGLLPLLAPHRVTWPHRLCGQDTQGAPELRPCPRWAPAFPPVSSVPAVHSSTLPSLGVLEWVTRAPLGVGRGAPCVSSMVTGRGR